MHIPDGFELPLSPQQSHQAGDDDDVHERPASLVALDSLLPVVQSLPGLTRNKKGLYYMGCHRISAVDREPFNELVKRIGELTIPQDGHAGLSPQVFGILTRLQDSNLPLFPSLYRLRVTGFSTALDFLHLFLTPSLTTLEFDMTLVDSDHDPLILDFLETVAYEALDIKNVILKLGANPGEVLTTCMKFQGIRRLELSTTLLMTLHDLEQIGSLERLESLVLHAPKTPDKVSDLSEHDANQTGTRITNDAPGQSNQPDRSLFLTLKELTVAGNSILLGNLFDCVGSPDLRELSVTFTSEVEDVSTPISKKKGKTKSVRSVLVDISAAMQDTRIISIVKSSAKKWVNSLVSVRFCSQGSTIPAISFSTNILENLLLCTQIEEIEIADSVDVALHSLKELPSSKLKVLHLPIHTAASGISLSQLRIIALHCPQLVSLRCRFEHLLNVPTYDTGPDPLSHQLEVLTVANAEPRQDQRGLPQTARYLDSLFPNLKAIETRNEPGFNGEQWQAIFYLIGLFQSARLDEKYRQGKVKA